MKQLINVYKPKGLTPLQTIQLVKQKLPEYQHEKIGFAGRLDPLAHGILLLMVGEETTKQKDRYLNLPKVYEFEVVFGLATDTYDVLGLLQIQNHHSAHDIKKSIKSKLGKHQQPYPPFSSKTVGGKPLFWWAKNNKLSEIEIPKREIEIFDFTEIETNTINAEKLKQEIFKQIALVEGDFRQEIIKIAWEDFFDKNKQTDFQTAKFSLSCSSGTYVRSLANEMGAITLDILRTKVGEYDLKTSIRV